MILPGLHPPHVLFMEKRFRVVKRELARRPHIAPSWTSPSALGLSFLSGHPFLSPTPGPWPHWPAGHSPSQGISSHSGPLSPQALPVAVALGCPESHLLQPFLLEGKVNLEESKAALSFWGAL